MYFDSDTKLYKLEWEEKNKEIEKENDYTGQKIGLYWNLDELEKLSVGEYISKKFGGLWYAGEIVSINLDTKFCCIWYTN